MRLKFLFFPIILVISLSIFIGYIWPEINNLKMANDEKIKNQGMLQDIAAKQAAIAKIDSQMTSNSADTATINNYLPSTRVEERILSGVNFLASDAGVSLANISLKDAQPATAAGVDVTTSINTTPSNVAAVNSLSSTSGAIAGTAVQQAPPESLQYTEATISVSGNYDKIRLFVDELQRMPILNVVKSLNISSQISAAPAATPASTTPASSDQKVDPSILSANLVVDFGYMNPIRIDNQKITNFQSSLDDATTNVVKSYISQKAPAVDNSGDSSGKSNPFLP